MILLVLRDGPASVKGCPASVKGCSTRVKGWFYEC